MEGYYWRFADPASGRAVIVAVRRLPRAGRAVGAGRAGRPSGRVRALGAWPSARGRTPTGSAWSLGRRRPILRGTRGPPQRRPRSRRAAGGLFRRPGGLAAPRVRRARAGAGRARAAAVLAAVTCSARASAARRGSARTTSTSRARTLRGEELGRRVPGRVVVGPGGASAAARWRRSRAGACGGPLAATRDRRARGRRGAALRAAGRWWSREAGGGEWRLRGAQRPPPRAARGRGRHAAHPARARAAERRAILRSEHHLAGPPARAAAPRRPDADRRGVPARRALEHGTPR